MGVIFVAGTYGVGKSTLIKKLSQELNILEYSASDLISSVNKEEYGSDKIVKDKNKNQFILIDAVKKILNKESSILLAGHFNIFGEHNQVEELPRFVYEELEIELILLLEAEIEKIQMNLMQRDNRKYKTENLISLQNAERSVAEDISSRLNKPLYVHKMNFDLQDVTTCTDIIRSNQNGH